MLKSLTIQNYALIKHLELNPNKGLNIITGETGAGKSIMLGALGLLLGKRAAAKVVWDEDRKCIIEGVFDVGAYALQPLFERFDMDYEKECIIRRELTAKGKSRAFVNDTPATLDFLKLLAEGLMDVHSQHETLQLGSNDYQLSLIDAIAGNHTLKSDFEKAFQLYKEQQKIYEDLLHDSREMTKEADYHQFLFDELDKAQLQADEKEELENDLNKLEHAEEIKLKLNTALEIGDRSEINLSQLIKELTLQISAISNYDSAYATLKDRLSSLQIEWSDILNELNSEEMKVEVDPEKMLACQDRLSLIYKLEQKHAVNSIAELLEIYEDLGNKLMRLGNLDEAVEVAAKALKNSEKEAIQAAELLSKSRKNVFDFFTKTLQSLLAELGMPHAKLEVAHKTETISKNGIDVISIGFSANKGVAPQTLKEVASGGEFSRLMFAIKFMLADKKALPTLVFDEIDTGISGEIAIKMAHMMQAISKNHQVITITHLPQIAAKGQSHYFVYKDDSADTTISSMRLLSEEERLKELAEMIGGKDASQTAYQSAKELMA
mgnify:CR=1 FL=1